MKILVLGANGLIGSTIFKVLSGSSQFKYFLLHLVLIATTNWWSCTKWDSYVFQNLINNLWVLTTPLTHKTTHKKLGGGF